MATVEVAAPIGLIASEEEQVHAIDEAVKVTEIEPTTKKAFEEEPPASSPAANVPATEETVDENPTVGEDSAEKLTHVTSPSSEPEAESAQVESMEEAVQVPQEADPAKEVSVAEAPAESTAVETAAEEKVEESSAKEEAAAEVAEEKTASVEESVVEEAKPAEAAPAEEKAEGEGKTEE